MAASAKTSKKATATHKKTGKKITDVHPPEKSPETGKDEHLDISSRSFLNEAEQSSREPSTAPDLPTIDPIPKHKVIVPIDIHDEFALRSSEPVPDTTPQPESKTENKAESDGAISSKAKGSELEPPTDESLLSAAETMAETTEEDKESASDGSQPDGNAPGTDVVSDEAKGMPTDKEVKSDEKLDGGSLPDEAFFGMPEDDKLSEATESPGIAKTATEEEESKDSGEPSEDVQTAPGASPGEVTNTGSGLAPDSQNSEDTSIDAEKNSKEAKKFAEEEVKRHKEWQAYINSRKFNVPIDAVAHRRSVKVSVLLTIIVFLLACALVDLLLDSGLIILIQKIPHTHFFEVIRF
jgi:hypothetical protein